MNRTGLVIALLIAAVVGVLFAVYPRLDIDISAFFYNRQINLFKVNAQPWVNFTRDAVRWVTALIFAPAVLVLIGKLIMPKRHMPMGGRAALFLILTMALGPGVLTHLVLKEHWGRARPIDITELGGDYRFTPWWDPRGDCPDNCSFVAGEPSGGFWTDYMDHIRAAVSLAGDAHERRGGGAAAGADRRGAARRSCSFGAPFRRAYRQVFVSPPRFHCLRRPGACL